MVIQLQYTGLEFHRLLPGNIRLISGPGCPVCVTGTDFIDKAIAYSRMENVIITTFGDLIRVPGSFHPLKRRKQQEQISGLFFQVWMHLKSPGQS